MSEYTTVDLGFAAYLRTKGFEMARASRETDGRKRVVFVFAVADAAMPNLETSLKGWIDGSAMVSARDYQAAMRELKTLVHLV